MPKIIDLNDIIGKKVGRWTVKSYSRVVKGQKHYYFCDCSCGLKNAEVLRGSLVNEISLSCGCYRNEIVTKNSAKITPEMVREIRLRTLPAKKWAELLGMDQSHINHILNGRHWAHIQ